MGFGYQAAMNRRLSRMQGDSGMKSIIPLRVFIVLIAGLGTLLEAWHLSGGPEKKPTELVSETKNEKQTTTIEMEAEQVTRAEP